MPVGEATIDIDVTGTAGIGVGEPDATQDGVYLADFGPPEADGGFADDPVLTLVSDLSYPSHTPDMSADGLRLVFLQDETGDCLSPLFACPEATVSPGCAAVSPGCAAAVSAGCADAGATAVFVYAISAPMSSSTTTASAP